MEHEIDLTGLAYGGEAMGRLPDGRVVFVPFGLPGDRARILITGQKRKYARGELLEILSPSPDRIPPRCPHFMVCGGCQYQNLPYEGQIMEKTRILREQLQRIGSMQDPPVRDMVPSTHEWNYRNQVQFHLGAQGAPGFVNARGNAVIPISECHLPEELINEFWPQLHFESNKHMKRIGVRAGAGRELMLRLESDVPEVPELEIEGDVSVVHVCEGQVVTLAGRDHLTMDVLGIDFRVSAESFFQVNAQVAGKMVDHLIGSFSLGSSDTVMEVYCGVGLFSKFLAPRCGRLIAIESSASACEDFSFNLNEYDHLELYEGSAAEVIPLLEVKPDLVLVDPPRAGLETRVLDGILNMAPRQVAYVSCNPSTLARDAVRFLRGGYRMRESTPFDIFPQTYHIESISIFDLS